MARLEPPSHTAPRLHLLLAFGAEMLERCRALGHEPIVYGSLAYLALTGDRSAGVGDIDVLITEAAFPDLLSLALPERTLRFEETSYHSIKVFDGPLKVSFDSLERYLAGLSSEACRQEVDGLEFDAVSRETLVEVYRRSAASIPTKRDAYLRKLAGLAGPAR